MPACNNSPKDDKDSINLLTTLLIRYPEICTVSYTGQKSRLQLRFILKHSLSTQDHIQFQVEIHNCLKSYIYFAKAEEPQVFEVKYKEGSGIGVVEIVRDAATLTREEIGFLISYMQERFPAQLVYDDLDFPEDELIEQEDLISNMLEKLKKKYPQYNLMAVREEGRVLVFKR